MNRLVKTTITICTTTIALCSLSLSAQAQTWSGRGRVVEGLDRGASVPLQVEVRGSTATIQSNPTPREKVQLNIPKNTDRGVWEIRRCAPNLCAILKQPQRTIHYRIPPK